MDDRIETFGRWLSISIDSRVDIYAFSWRVDVFGHVDALCLHRCDLSGGVELVNEFGSVVGHVVAGHLFHILKFEFDVRDVPVVDESTRNVDKVGSEDGQATLREDAIGANFAPFEVFELPRYKTSPCC